MSFKKPDIKGPRFRETRLSILDSKLCCEFKKKYPQYKSVDNEDLKDTVKVFNELFWNKVIENRDGVEMPEGLGYLFIGTCPSPVIMKNYDIKKSIEYNTGVRHRNFDSDNYLAKIFYTNFPNKYKFLHRDIWRFKAIRQFSRAVAKEYPENWKKYLQVDNFAHISHIFKERIRDSKKERLGMIIPEGYDEFDLK